MWNVINRELARKPSEPLDFTELIKVCNGVPVTSKQEVADALNAEFVGAAAACGAPRADVRAALAALGARAPPLDRSIRFQPFTPGEVAKIMQVEIAPKNSQDIYELSPSILKFVKIAPLYKGKGQKSAGKSYRPISLVPALSKVMEVGLNQRLLSFWLSQNVISDRQYAYQRGCNSTDLVREVIWAVMRAREAGRLAAVLCCDLLRAFDTADHNLVEAKLDHYGFRGPALKVLVSFMRNRTQTVVGDRGRVRSAEQRSIMGVPQGSCLSNTLFTVLLNDLPGALEGTEVFMYADDVTVVTTAPNEQLLEEALNDTVHKLYIWFAQNGLSLNTEKTCFLRVSLNGHPSSDLKIHEGNTNIQQVMTTKLLGFVLDSSLCWRDHIDALCARLGQACYALRRLASTASRYVVRSCYFATVHSILSYGTELWGRAADFDRAFRMQKRAVRGIVGIRSDESARDHFKDLRKKS
ncbi:uncharacterized protein LOC125232732 [Leguminivora glycinivorella]|uniref:uncharacterized protein LOC125232732 n=1 Tax=Leguminivora glycinivorella TaxID=1035111 RepID=UPI00200EF433|nr:uncharacterized protein LOC125232732 [Leguminivora glycinivorella]